MRPYKVKKSLIKNKPECFSKMCKEFKKMGKNTSTKRRSFNCTGKNLVQYIYHT
jgi:hypothetical protein